MAANISQSESGDSTLDATSRTIELDEGTDELLPSMMYHAHSSTSNTSMLLQQSELTSTSADDIYLDDDEFDFSKQSNVERVLKKLSFINPGDKNRMREEEIRKRPRAAVNAKKGTEKKTDFFHDSKGHLVVNGQTVGPLCDCLRPSCNGCFWPCSKCASQRCGPICQRGRSFVAVSDRQIGADNGTRLNPYIERED